MFKKKKTTTQRCASSRGIDEKKSRKRFEVDAGHAGCLRQADNGRREQYQLRDNMDFIFYNNIYIYSELNKLYASW